MDCMPCDVYDGITVVVLLSERRLKIFDSRNMLDVLSNGVEASSSWEGDSIEYLPRKLDIIEAATMDVLNSGLNSHGLLKHEFASESNGCRLVECEEITSIGSRSILRDFQFPIFNFQSSCSIFNGNNVLLHVSF